MAGVITIAVPAVGTLLIFALVITPAATANIHRPLPIQGDGRSPRVLCLVSIWAGLVLSAMFPAPPSFIIVTLSTLFWAVSPRPWRSLRKKVAARSIGSRPRAKSDCRTRRCDQQVSTKASAIAATPSPRTSESHMPSVVVAVTDTAQPTAADSARFGFSPACADFRPVADHRPPLADCTGVIPRSMPDKRHNVVSQHIGAMHCPRHARPRADTEQGEPMSPRPGRGKQRVNQTRARPHRHPNRPRCHRPPNANRQAITALPAS